MILEAGAWAPYEHPYDLHELLRELIAELGVESESRERHPLRNRETRRTAAHILERQDRRDPQDRIRRITDRWSFSGPDFSVQDFSEWVVEQFGRRLLPTQSIRPDASIEFGFDAAAVVAILCYQNYPCLKDILVYAAGVLRAYTGQAKQPRPGPDMKPPRLTPSMRQFLGGYDEVHLDVDNKETRWSLDLRRNKT